MIRATFRSLLARKLRLLLSATSIVLGVSFVAGAFVLTDSLGKVFDDLFRTVNAHVAVDVRGQKAPGNGGSTETTGRTLVPAATLDRVRSVPGVSAAEGSVVGTAQLVDSNGKVVTTGGAPTFGFNWVASPDLNVAKIIQGRAPRGPDEIVLNRSLAEKAGYRVNDTAPVLTDAPAKRYTIVGIVGYENNQGSLGGSTNIFFDTPTAQRVFNRVATYDEITVAARGGVGQQELRDRVQRVLPAKVEAITGKAYSDEQSSDVKKGLSFFSTFLLVFAVIALFVGAFIIFNTFSMLVAQRTRELALMRALGASRSQVTRSVLLEALIVGAVSSVIGLGAGVGVAALLKVAFGAFGAEFPDGPTIIAVRTVIASFAVGTVVTALAALMPARRASKVAPIAAMREAATPDRSMTRQTVAGGVLLAAGAAALAKALTGGGLPLLGAGTFLAFIGIALLSPLVSRPVAGAVGLLFSRSLPGRLGRQNSLRNPRRTASTAAALMIGLALVSAISVLGASLKASVEKVIDTSVGADFVLNVQGSGFPDEVVRAVARTPGVASATGVKGDGAQLESGAGGGDRAVGVTAIDPRAIGSSITFSKVAGSVATVRPTTLLMSAKEADARKLRVGDQVSLRFAKGSLTLTLAGTYKDNQLVGNYVVHPDAARDFSSARNLGAVVKLSPGANVAHARKAIEHDVAAYPNIQVQDRTDFVADQAKQVDQIVSIISILLLLSVIIAVLGVVNTLALSVIERTRELGLLRAVGMARRQVKRMVRVEAVVISVFGGILGLVVGAAFGVALQQALKGQGVTELDFPLTRMVLFLLGAALAGVLAAWLPARRAARLNVLEAIATE